MVVHELMVVSIEHYQVHMRTAEYNHLVKKFRQYHCTEEHSYPILSEDKPHHCINSIRITAAVTFKENCAEYGPCESEAPNDENLNEMAKKVCFLWVHKFPEYSE
jgi:hypothetical protein